MKYSRNIINITTCLLLSIILAVNISCEKNSPPAIAQLIAVPQNVEPDGASTISVLATDSDGDALIYLWEANKGELISDNSLSSITWKAPSEGGIYYCKVSVNDGKEIVSDSVAVTVSEDPVLSIDKDTLYYDTESNHDSFTISNSGNGVLDWSTQTITDDGGSWIQTVSPDHGATVSNSPQLIDVVVDRTGLAGGVYSGRIDITSDDTDRSVHIVMDVAELLVNPGQLNFGSRETELTLDISNGGSGELNYNISADRNWISADPAGGSLTDQTETITILVDRTGLSPGDYSGQLSVSSNAGEVLVSVEMKVVEGPVLHVDPTVLDFGETESNKSFFIQNHGGETLTWSISENLDWIEVNPNQGSTRTETTEVKVTVIRTVLNPGSHSGKITVNSNGGTQEITIGVTVVQGPVLKVNTDILNFGQVVSTRAFFIQNDGGGTLNWTVSESLGWLSVSPASGSTSSTDTENIQVTVDRSQLNPGSYSGTIRINSNGGNAEITVNMTVAQGPVLDVSVSELDFGSSLNTLNFIISNGGGETLEWSITENLEWLDIKPSSGSLTTDSEEIEVSVDRSVLSEGDHSGNINIKSNGGDAEIRVSIRIQAAGEWLIFDDGTFEKNFTTNSNYLFFLTQFDRPSDWKEFKITRVAISFMQSVVGADNIELFCFSTQLVNRRYYPHQSLFGTAVVDPSGGWNEWKVDWTLDIERFCVGYRQTQSSAPRLHIDTNQPQRRAYYVTANNQGFSHDSGNWAIRVFVVKSGSHPEQGQWLDVKTVTSHTDPDYEIRIENN